MIPLTLVRWQSVVDFFVLTAALYILLKWAQQDLPAGNDATVRAILGPPRPKQNSTDMLLSEQ